MKGTNTMGRRPTPTHLQVVTGTFRAKRRLKTEPKPARVSPRRPTHLSAGAVKAWLELAPLLGDMGVLTKADGMALEMVCELIAEVRRLRSLLIGKELLHLYKVGKDDRESIRPEVAAIASHDARIRQWLAEFGLTPAARTKVSADPSTKAEKKDAADAYFG